MGLRLDRNVIQGFVSLSTATISDALDRFGLRGGCEGIFCVGDILCYMFGDE